MIMSLVSLVVMSASSHAMLPPYYDRAKQIQTVLDAPEVYNALGGRPINKIETDGSLRFTLDAGTSCAHYVDIEVIPVIAKPGTPVPVGATEYRIKKVNAVCLPSTL